jgi:stage V sporulation protein D (sporulation-specific penicillin-binding protein)
MGSVAVFEVYIEGKRMDQKRPLYGRSGEKSRRTTGAGSRRYGRNGTFKGSRRRRKNNVAGGAPVNAMNRRRLGGAFLLILLLFSLLVFRVAYWQIVRADDMSEKATEMQRADTELDPVRGTIYDSEKKPLAQTVTKYELYGYSQNLYKSDQLSDAEKEKNVKDLAKITDSKEDDIRELLSGKDNLVKLASGLSNSAIRKAKKEFGGNIVVKTKVSRSYPNGDFASSAIGCVNSENSGRTGLEYQYNSVLSGVKGRVVRTTDSQGNTLAVGSSKYYEAQDGSDIVTTIDSVIQSYVESAVDKGMKDTKAESITAIVMDPKTGDVLAMANSPSFDPNDPSKPSGKSEQAKFNKMSSKEQSDYLSRMWTNTAISTSYEPGSTFKLITAAAALECGSSTSSSRYYDPGYINVDGTKIHCWDSAHGSQTLKEAVGNSCNPALARVALDMGADEFYKYIDLFGFNDKTGIDLPGEGESIIKDKDSLSKVDLATMGFGQGIAITPIQLLTAVNSLGNDGVLMKPKVVKKIISSDGSTTTIPDTKVRHTVSKQTADQMCDIMEYYVKEGGGTSAYIAGYRVGGKTGTANIASGGGYSEQTVASFIAMAPMDDPQVSVLVMVTKPKKSIYGAANAGPIVKNILKKTLVYMGVEKKYSSDEKQSIDKAEVTVPDVTGMSSTKAAAKIRSAGLKAKAMPEGSGKSFHVVDQYPKAGEKTEKGGTVYIYSE